MLILYALKKRDEAEGVKAQLAVLLATATVKGLEAEKKARQDKLKNNAAQRAALSDEIVKAKERVLAIHQDTSRLTPIEICNEYKKMGY